MPIIVCNDQRRFLRLLQITSMTQADAVFVPTGDLSKLSEDTSERPVVVLGQPQTCADTVKLLTDAGISNHRIASAVQPAKVFSTLKKYMSGDLLETVKLLIRENYFERAYYAYPMMVAAAQAKTLGLPGFKAIELGVWTGTGLINLASIASVVSDAYELEIEVVGFDTGEGMPESIGWPDHPELWQEGQLVMPDFNKLRQRLPANSHLIIGDVGDTIQEFAKGLSKDSPLGFVSLDLDYYSSSASALKVFDLEDQRNYLPATPLYVDDSYIGITQHELAGEALAIHMKNVPNKRAIEEGRFEDAELLILRKHVRPGQQGMAWHHCMYFAHMLRHPVRQGQDSTKLSGLHHVHF